MKKAYFAGGCFWCITPSFEELDGVVSVTSGYSGGDEENPKYEDVKHQKTGHRESIEIEYEQTKVCFEKLLSVFLENIDPFDGEGQFIDRGFSYTTAVYYNDESEKKAAEQALERLAKESGKQPCVSIEEFKTFWRAEEYHQDYWKKNPEAFEKELRESGRKKD